MGKKENVLTGPSEMPQERNSKIGERNLFSDDGMPFILVRCIGYAGLCSDSGELPPREGEKPSKRNSRLQSFCNRFNRSQTRPFLGQV